MNKQIEIQFISDKENNWTPEFGKTADRLLKKEFGDNPDEIRLKLNQIYDWNDKK